MHNFSWAKNLITIGLCVLLVGFGIERTIGAAKTPSPSSKSTAKSDAKEKKPREKKPSGKKANAKQLLGDARKSLAFMIKSARADKGLDSKVPKNKPFWRATKKIAKSLSRAEKGLAAKSDDFFLGISDARSAEEQLKIDWQLTDSKNKQVIDGGKKLGHAIAMLRTDFSKEAARKKKGGDLSAAEKKQFAKIKAQQQALIAKIDRLEGKAKKDKALQHGLKKMKKQAEKIVQAPETVDAFVSTLYLVDEIEGMLYGYDYYVDREYRTDWVDVAQTTTAWETTYTEISTSETYEWSEVETSVDIDVSEEVEISETLTSEEIETEENYAETEAFEMTDAEEDQVAAEEDTDESVDSDDADDDDSMDDDSDDDGEDFDGDGEDDGAEDDGGDSDDGGGDDDGGDEGDE